MHCEWAGGQDIEDSREIDEGLARRLGPYHQEGWGQIHLHLLRDWEALGYSLAAFFWEEGRQGVTVQMKVRERERGESWA